MIVSENKKPTPEKFAKVVKKANDFLNDDARKREGYYLSKNGERLEDEVVNALNFAARFTPFDGSIVKVSGHKFPDIVAGKYLGVEVKSSKNDQQNNETNKSTDETNPKIEIKNPTEENEKTGGQKNQENKIKKYKHHQEKYQ